jgi:hypothetical protein
LFFNKPKLAQAKIASREKRKKMNGFEKHNIKWTSPSSINTFSAAPDVWVAEKLFGVRGTMSASALRGIVIEEAVVNVIARGFTQEAATESAQKRFNKETMFSGSEKVADEFEVIEPIINIALKELAQYGEPEFATPDKQDKIELLCKGDGWELPVIGYTDLPFPKHGLIVDLKTTLKAPSAMSDAHNRQAAIYRKASGNNAVRFLYCTPKKAIWHECVDLDGTLAEVKQILNRQERFLSVGDKELLRDIVHFDPNSFYWNGAESNRREVFGR